MASRQLSSNDLETVPKAFLLGWIAGYRAIIEENRKKDTKTVLKSGDCPVTTLSLAANVAYYNGEEHVLNELETLLTGV